MLSWLYSVFTPESERGPDRAVYDPAKSKPAKELAGESYNIVYGDDSYSAGIVYTDSVNIGGAVAIGQAVELATNVSSSFYTDPAIDGFLGLGLATGNEGMILGPPFQYRKLTAPR